MKKPKLRKSNFSKLFQPHPATSIMQLSITAASLCIAAATVTYTVLAARGERNARLVEIGVSVLRVDPTKDGQGLIAARKWAMDLIDDNAGGIKFSDEARAELLVKRFEVDRWGGTTLGVDTYDEYFSRYVPDYLNKYLPDYLNRHLPKK